MSWIIALVTLSLVMTVLTIAELWQPVKGNGLHLPDQSVGDRIIAVFVVVTFAAAFVNGVLLLAGEMLR